MNHHGWLNLSWRNRGQRCVNSHARIDVVDCGVNDGTLRRLFSGRIGLVGVVAWSLRHILFPLWLFVNNDIRSHCCVVSPHPHVSTKCVVFGVVVWGFCLVVAFCDGRKLIIVILDFGQAFGKRRGEEYRCKSLIFYLVAFFYNRINGKTSTTNKITVIWYCTYD